MDEMNNKPCEEQNADVLPEASPESNKNDKEPTYMPSFFTKKIFSVSVMIFAVLLAVLVTFMGTFWMVSEAKDAKYKNAYATLQQQYDQLHNSVLGVVIDDEARLQMYKKLLELDRCFAAYAFSDYDLKQITNYILAAYTYATGDLYAEYYDEDAFYDIMSSMQGESQGVGINIAYDPDTQTIVVINVMPDSPAQNNGVMPGDKIIYVGRGESKEYVPEIGYTAALIKLQGVKGTLAEFTVLRGDEEIEFSILRDEFKNQSVMSHIYSLDKSVGVVRIMNFDNLTPVQLKGELDKMNAAGIKKIVFDLRNNPGGTLTSIVQILDNLLPEGPIIRIIDKTGAKVDGADSDANALYTDMEFVVLVNENTASAAELFTSALMDYDRAIVVGVKTYGKGSMQTTFQMEAGGGVKFTTHKYLPPYSESYDGIGITPDVVEELDEALKNKSVFLLTDEEDNQLAAAVRAFN